MGQLGLLEPGGGLTEPRGDDVGHLVPDQQLELRRSATVSVQGPGVHAGAV